ncbi:MAG: serine/threonine-protein kinase [Cyanobacteria bacterium J06638_28]
MTTFCINPSCPQPENSEDRDRCLGCGSKLRLGDRFRPFQLLGQGGFGRTVLAWDEGQSPPQQCVIKQIMRSQGSRELDLAEANRLAKLGQHPQIPALIAILDSPRDICLVQTYVPGRTLEQVLIADGPFTETQVRSLLLALLPVLQFVHEQGVIHRDIKPANILLPVEEDALPVLVDFGAARSTPTATELTRTGTVIGSAGYAAPEQALGKAVPASDLYSLGMTCLHLLTGQHPFDLYSVMEDRWIWESLLPKPVSPSLSRVLTRLTARSLRSRYTSAPAALVDLAPAGIVVPATSTSLLIPTSSNWACRRTWPTPGRVVNAIAVSPNGQAIATANSDGTVQLWDWQTGDILHTFGSKLDLGNRHNDAVTAIQFHPDEQTLLTGSRDGTVKRWDLRTYRLQQTLTRSGWPVTAIALSTDGQKLITAATNGHMTFWTLPEGIPQVDLVRHAGAVNGITLSPDGTRLASVGAAGTLRLWTIPEGQLIHTWTTQQGLSAVALSTTAPALITGNVQGKVMRWSLRDFQSQQTFDQHQDEVNAIALSPNEQFLATGSRDQEIHLWDWQSNARVRLAVLRHDWAVQHLIFTSDNRTLISSAADETLRFWNVQA